MPAPGELPPVAKGSFLVVKSPGKKLANDKPKGEAIACQTLLDAWKTGKVRC